MATSSVMPVLVALVALVAVVAVVAVAALPPILKFVTGVVDVTTKGAVPVAIVEVNCVPEMVEVAATEAGVMAPRVKVMAGVVVAVATDPLTPLAVTTDAEVTVPVFAVAPVAIPSNFVLSAELILPAALVVAALIEIAGAVPPDETIGAVPLTAVTVPVAGVAHDKLPAVAPAVKTFPLFVVLVAIT